MAAEPGLRGRIDGVAIHPYASTADGVLERVRQARAILASNGLASVPLYVTEFGWTTQPAHALDWAPAGRRPGYISRTLGELGHTDCGISAAVLYTWLTAERNPADREDWYGISSPSAPGDPTADVTAFAAGIRSAGSASAPATSTSPC
jgi:hypothetical protein